MTAKSVYRWMTRYITIPLLGMGCFVVYVCFINEDNSVLDRMKYDQRIEELNAQIEQHRDSLNYYVKLNQALDTDRATMERVVRENYHMQRQNEDIYVFE